MSSEREKRINWTNLMSISICEMLQCSGMNFIRIAKCIPWKHCILLTDWHRHSFENAFHVLRSVFTLHGFPSCSSFSFAHAFHNYIILNNTITTTVCYVQLHPWNAMHIKMLCISVIHVLHSVNLPCSQSPDLCHTGYTASATTSANLLV